MEQLNNSDSEGSKNNIDIPELVNGILEKIKNSDSYLFFGLDYNLIGKFLRRALNTLVSNGTPKYLRKWGMKDILMKHHFEEYLKNVDVAFKEFFKPYILVLYYREEDTASIMDVSFELIKTIEESKNFHLNYVRHFFEALVNNEEFSMPIPAKKCPFYLYMQKLEILKNDSIYMDIIKYHEDFHEAVSHALSIKDKGFDECFLGIKEIDRLSSKLLELLNSLLIKLLSKITVYDPLTQVFNRNYICYVLNRELNRSKRHGLDVSLLMIDIDDFKSINDRYGHIVGDEALKHVARIIKKSVRSTDIPVRYGGEEFLVILPHTDVKSAERVAERIRLAIKEKPFRGISLYT